MSKDKPSADRPVSFNNKRFIELLSTFTGITPVGELARETPLDLSSLEAARGSLLLKELFSKYDDGKPSSEKEAATWKRFHQAETDCAAANSRIAGWTWSSDPFWVMVRARIHKLLGDFPHDALHRSMAHGPGATTRLTHATRFAAYKYSGEPESTIGNLALAQVALATNPLWNRSVPFEAESPPRRIRIREGNQVISVPKNYKTDRTIAKDPCMNIYVQKGIGRIIRRLLKSVGVDLDDQSQNQRAARLGSLTGLLATIDLAMASDTLASELVYFLLPLDWLWYLEQARSPSGVLPSGELITYQKFSSMGNGYTFELEALIFWAICQQVCVPDTIHEMDMSICVYGDDIVVPSKYAESVIMRLVEAGFTPNKDKTYISGPYRESCGKHYWNGFDITPFYIRRPVDRLTRLFLVHNNLSRWLSRLGVDNTDLLKSVRQLAPAAWREPRLPDGYGDGAFIGAIDELHLQSHPHGWDCWQVKALQVAQKQQVDDLPDGQVVASIMMQLQRFYIVDSPVPPSLWRTCWIDEVESGLPVREGVYRSRNITIPRSPLPQRVEAVF